jgi:hypothetical protein
VFFFQDVAYDTLKAILEYMYLGEVQISNDKLKDFIRIGEALQLRGLSNYPNFAVSDSFNFVVTNRWNDFQIIQDEDANESAAANDTESSNRKRSNTNEEQIQGNSDKRLRIISEASLANALNEEDDFDEVEEEVLPARVSNRIVTETHNIQPKAETMEFLEEAAQVIQQTTKQPQSITYMTMDSFTEKTVVNPQQVTRELEIFEDASELTVNRPFQNTYKQERANSNKRSTHWNTNQVSFPLDLLKLPPSNDKPSFRRRNVGRKSDRQRNKHIPNRHIPESTKCKQKLSGIQSKLLDTPILSGLRPRLLKRQQPPATHATHPQSHSRHLPHLPKTLQLWSLLETTLCIDTLDGIGGGRNEGWTGNDRRCQFLGQLELSKRRRFHSNTTAISWDCDSSIENTSKAKVMALLHKRKASW